jgi:predicted DNA-binding protein (UPF0251 family)
MPRPRLFRRVGFEPEVTYFKPAGIRMIDLEESILTVDEFEAVRLKDLEGMEQEEAAKKMSISQPTFHRLILSARKKIADAIVNGKAIRIEGGNYMFARRFRPGAGMGRGRGMGAGMGPGGPGAACVCPKCGYAEAKVAGIPCTSRKCPECGSMMVRGD